MALFPWNIPTTYFCYRPSLLQAHSAVGMIRYIEKNPMTSSALQHSPSNNYAEKIRLVMTSPNVYTCITTMKYSSDVLGYNRMKIIDQ
jgi:hypothetical protein